MDIPLHWTLDYIKDLLPPETLPTLQTYLLAPSSPLHTIRRQATALTAQLLPFLTTALDHFTAFLADSPNLVAGAAILVLAVLILQVLSLVRRIMLFWTRLAFRLLWWAGVALLASVVWQRGVGRSAADAVAVALQVGGWVAGWVQVWWREYERAQAEGQGQGRQGRQGPGQQGRVGGDGGGGAGWR